MSHGARRFRSTVLKGKRGDAATMVSTRRLVGAASTDESAAANGSHRVSARHERRQEPPRDRGAVGVGRGSGRRKHRRADAGTSCQLWRAARALHTFSESSSSRYLLCWTRVRRFSLCMNV
jgi:hypothetical protein